MESLYRYQDQVIAGTKFLFRRNFLDQVHWNERLIGIVGPRGVGKTTCILQYISGTGLPDRSKLYVSMDNLANPYHSIIELAEKFYREGGTHLFLDEIHKYSGWAAELKTVYDLLPQLKVVFSGSSILHLLTGGVDLSRRAVYYHLQGLSFREFLGIQAKIVQHPVPLQELIRDHEKIASELIRKIRPLQHFRHYLQWGYYPFYLQSTETYPLKLESTLNFVIESEIPVISNLDIKNISKIKRALQFISENAPYQPNVTKLAEALELNRNTLLQYFRLLEKAGIILELYQTGTFYGKLTKPGKILLHHPNLAFCLSPKGINPGSIREAFFANQLMMHHKVELSGKADFLIDGKYTFELGGKGKSGRQLSGLSDGYIVADDIEQGLRNKIPLWLFGFLY
jgi:uncharacterized protein